MGARKSCPREYVSRSTWISRDIGIYKWIAKSHLNHPVPIYTNMVLSCLLQHSVSLKSIGLSPFARQTIAVSGRIYEPFSNTPIYHSFFHDPLYHIVSPLYHHIISKRNLLTKSNGPVAQGFAVVSPAGFVSNQWTQFPTVLTNLWHVWFFVKQS